ncbi:MAG: hypothetical protein NCW75_03555 [Phycisphaera sp.]|nr:MAG: hypothetical protein NCW75_03555 [Phycisphaera sp.]
MADYQAGYTFDDAWILSLALDHDGVAERIAALRGMLMALDGRSGISAPGVLEDGQVVVRVTTGADKAKWAVPYHLAWPEPRLNNHHLTAVKFLSWNVVGEKGPVTAGRARQTAHDRLRKAIQDHVDTGGPLAKRIRILQ